jgi:hypothetical protein
MINFKSYTNDGAKIVVFHELYKKMADYLWLCPNTAQYGRYEEKCIFFLKNLEISKIVRTFAK